MGTTAEKLTYLNETKTQLKDMLNLSGASLTTEPFRQYVDTLKNRYLYFMNNGIDVVWNNWDKVTGEGTALTLNNTEEAPMSLTYKGNTSQEGTPTPESPQDIHVVSGDNSIDICGKNLANISVIPNKTGQPTLTIANDTIIISNSPNIIGYTGTGKKLSELCPDLKVGDVAYLFFDTTSSSTNGNAIYIGQAWTKTNSKTITQAMLDATVVLYGGYEETAVISNFMITKVNDSSYQPYKSASYPINLGDIELCKIEDYQDKIDKSTGNNLVNVANISGSLSSQYYQNYETGYTLEAGKTYTLSLNANVSVTPFLLTVGAGETGYVRDIYTECGKQNGRISITFTPTSANLENATKLFIRCPRYNSATTTTYILSDIMLNEGSTTLEYEPYGTSWYLNKQIGKVVLDGSEANWSNQFGINLFSLQAFLNNNKFIVGYGLSNYYKYNSIQSGINTGTVNGEFALQESSGNYNLFMKNTDYSSVDNFKTWLSTHNTSIYYPLATPTYTQITDSTLLSQLEAIKRSYDEQTNISQNSNDLHFILNVSALKKNSSN